MRAIAIAAVAALALLAQAGHAAQRTFVSGGGNDLNACTITAPCRGFDTALTHTDPDGEIIVLDSAGYGTVTIDRSVAIIAPPGVYAGVSVFSGDGIVISGAGIEVVLRGLTINGQGGTRGIFYTFGARLRISNCVVSNMAGDGVRIGFAGEMTIEDSLIRDNGGNGVHITTSPSVIVTRTTVEGNHLAGIRFQPNVAEARLAVADSQILRNEGRGIYVNASGVPATFSVTRSIIARNDITGVRMESADISSPITALLNSNTIVHNNEGVHAFSNGGDGAISGTLSDNFVSDHFQNGIVASQTGVLLVLDRNTVTHNFNGIAQSGGGIIETRSNNTVRENVTNTFGGPFTAVGGT